MYVGMDEHLRRGLGCRIGIGGLQQRRLGKDSTAWSMVLSIDLVSTDVNETTHLSIGSTCLQKSMGSNDVVLGIQHRIREGGIYVALGGKMDDSIDLMLDQQPIKQTPVLNISFNKHVIV